MFSSPTPHKRANRKKALPKLPERFKTVIREIPGTEEVDLSHSAGNLIVRLHLRSRSVVVHEKQPHFLSAAASEETLHNVTHSLSQSSLTVSTRSVLDHETINPIFTWIDHPTEVANPVVPWVSLPREITNPIFPRMDHPKEITNPIFPRTDNPKEITNSVPPKPPKIDNQNEFVSGLTRKSSLLVKQRSIDKEKPDSSDPPSDLPKSKLNETPSYKSSILAVRSKSMFMEPRKPSKMVHSSTQVNFPLKCIFSRSESPETRPVERAIEARTGSEDGLGSMVRCLHFAHTYIANRKLDLYFTMLLV